MSDPVVVLPNGIVINHCKWRIETFVRHDAYIVYDFWGTYGQPTDTITRHHVEVMNSAMRARSSYDAWRAFFGQQLPELEQIARDLDLVDGNHNEVDLGLAALDALVRRITQQHHLYEMSATKVLHLLRPRFVAISDSYVRECLGLQTAHSGSLVPLHRCVRGLGRTNKEALDALHAYANSLSPVSRTDPWFRFHGNHIPYNDPIPVRLSNVRILDILMWTALGVKRNIMWGPTY